MQSNFKLSCIRDIRLTASNLNTHCMQIQFLPSCCIRRKHIRPHCSQKTTLFSNIRSSNLIEINENDKDEIATEKTTKLEEGAESQH